MEVGIFVFVWVFMAIASAVLANRFNRFWFGHALLSIILSPLWIVMVAAMGPAVPESPLPGTPGHKAEGEADRTVYY